jgi:hypothetical protein
MIAGLEDLRLERGLRLTKTDQRIWDNRIRTDERASQMSIMLMSSRDSRSPND